MFGGENEVVLNEQSELVPKSPYAASKVFAHHMTKIYRESYECFVLTESCLTMSHLYAERHL